MNSMAREDRITSGERQAGRSHAGTKAPVGFARSAAQLARMGDDELLAVFSEGDGYASSVLVDDVELAYECANGATFEGSVFRDCLFEQVDFGDCTFRDVRFEQCRFIGCTMDKGWRCLWRRCWACALRRSRTGPFGALSIWRVERLPDVSLPWLLAGSEP